MTLPALLSGKTVLVTGASGGLGRHFSLFMAGHGAAVAACGRRMGELQALADEIEARGGRSVALAMDVTSRDSIENAVAEAEVRLGPIDILVNNSGTSAFVEATAMDELDYDRVMDTNAKGSFFTATAVARRMIAGKRGGAIVSISSVAARRPFDGRTAYCMSKAAIDHMTRVLALEWARYGIRVNAIAPGWIGTEVNLPFFATEEGRDYMQKFPRRRIGRPEHLEQALLLLVSDASDFITGESILIDDGYSLAL